MSQFSSVRHSVCRKASCIRTGVPQHPNLLSLQRSINASFSGPRTVLAKALKKDSEEKDVEVEVKKSEEPGDATMDAAGILTSVGLAAAFGALLYYVNSLAPNQTPMRDIYLIQELIGLGDGDAATKNSVLYCLFNIMGIYPALYSALLIPSCRSRNNVPVWPFVTLSFGLGCFALFPYLCLWQPIDEKNSPPERQELEEGFGRFGMQALESSWLPATLLVGAGGLIAKAITAGGSEWSKYFQYVDESKFVHVMSLDFLIFTALMPFFLGWDAEKRDWDSRELGVPILSCLPVIGPAVYLVLRPRTPLKPSPKADTE